MDAIWLSTWKRKENESVAFQRIFMGVLNIICETMELLFLVQIVSGTDLSETPTKYSMS